VWRDPSRYCCGRTAARRFAMIDQPTAFSEQLALWLTMGKQALWVAAVRYLIIATPLFVLGYMLCARLLAGRRIQSRPVTTRQIVRELGWSLSTCVVFATIDVLVIVLSLAGVMRLRVVEPTPGLVEMVATVMLLLVVHDAYFYWQHRFLHWKPMFRIAHATHHRSLNPTPFATFAFHPIEAAVEYGYVPLLALFVPIHVMPLFVFGIVMTALNAYGHGGIELAPKGFVRHPVGRFLLTPTHHDLHHSSVDYNFGFYSSFWDRLMGTNHPRYAEEFGRVVSRRADEPAARAAQRLRA
jgi:sterol desaturase/sphingolipid hydroxylase (fatty acid hydroxylase superfamily)